MTEDVPDVTSSSTNTISDSKIMSEQTLSDNFLKPISLKNLEFKAKHKLGSLKNKDTTHSELKKKKKKPNKVKSTNQNKGEVEDATESVDSGCIADIAGDVTDWPQVEAAVLEERNYVLSLLSWLPDFQWVVPDSRPPNPSSKDEEEPEDKDEEKSTDKKTSNKKAEPLGTKSKLRDFLNETDEIDSLREKYSEMLTELRRNRNKNKGSKKREGKLQRKLKNLNRRNKKNSNRQRKLEQAEIFQVKHKALEAKKVVKHKKIFNEKGKLVFSKFDFSTDGNGMHPKKAKNLEHKVAKAIKEREMRKRLQKEGDLKAAAEIKEIEAWSSALQRADGAKVRDDLDMLQKSLKKKELRKKMNKKRWEERTEVLEKKMKDRQQKRQENLNARRETKLQKKGKKMKKKGHVVPGF